MEHLSRHHFGLSREVQHDVRRIAFVSNYAPRRDGIASFTYKLVHALSEAYPQVKVIVLAVTVPGEGHTYPPEVAFEIDEQDQVSYLRAADIINNFDIDVVCLQHDFSLYGGPSGSMILPFLGALKVPIVTTLHAIPHEPTVEQKRVLGSILSISSQIFTMAEASTHILTTIYATDPAKVELVPHAIPDHPFFDEDKIRATKKVMGFDGKRVMLTFGLLSPEKGVEFCIRALPLILAKFSDTVLVVLGETSPAVIREYGESYRHGLEWLARDLGVSDHVVFLNKYVEGQELLDCVGAADVVVIPLTHEDKESSGVLAYAVGLGAAIVSTPFWHAQDLLADGRGKMVPFNASDEIGTSVIDLFSNDAQRAEMKRKVYAHAREGLMAKATLPYFTAFEGATRSRPTTPVKLVTAELSKLPDVKLDHFHRMSDDCGMFQHGIHSVPDWNHGYCVDDTCRALMVVARLKAYGYQMTPLLERHACNFTAFLKYAYNEKMNMFHNFMSYDRRWLDEVGSDDSNGRCLMTLGCSIRYGIHVAVQASTFRKVVRMVEKWTAPRSWAFSLLGINDYLQKFADDGEVKHIQRVLATRLMNLYKDVSSPDWLWFENLLTYDNAVMPQSLIVTGKATGDDNMLRTGLVALEWLLNKQLTGDKTFTPVGNGAWAKKGAPTSKFDQQPLEAGGMVLACVAAADATGESDWVDAAYTAFDWFLGRNLHGKPLYDPASGGCCDGLLIKGVNENQGAESLLAFLLALIELKDEQYRNRRPGAAGFTSDVGTFK